MRVSVRDRPAQAWHVLTLLHGAVSNWYPFIDAARLGCAAALRNGLGMVVLMAGVAARDRIGDHRLPKAS